MLRLLSFILTSLIMTSPLSGFTSVFSMFTIVDLPAPFGPSIPKISPFYILKLTFFTASIFPKDFETELTVIMFKYWDKQFTSRSLHLRLVILFALFIALFAASLPVKIDIGTPVGL